MTQRIPDLRVHRRLTGIPSPFAERGTPGMGSIVQIPGLVGDTLVHALHDTGWRMWR
ncbi:hypothetical protein [Pseudomonas cedrina]|uniref:hypothetical protein n=1 Tax=Pseudomonas cedrina TaxID=651740 RepID=UPI002786CD9D|nr:hypothetical protein [Pseudomonas cedrina]